MFKIYFANFATFSEHEFYQFNSMEQNSLLAIAHNLEIANFLLHIFAFQKANLEKNFTLFFVAICNFVRHFAKFATPSFNVHI